MIFYFVSELIIHGYGNQMIEEAPLEHYTKKAINSGVHEAMEFIVVTGIFYIYRARQRGEFFSLMLQHDDVTIPRIIPFYVADKTNFQDTRAQSKYAVILKPRGEDATLMSSVLLGVSSRSTGNTRPSEPGNAAAAQPLLARSVELQSY
mmetsp:Transcript_23832/g.42199  ORF Transcript_23832/g.42199 Transcript_23832/m.42199 type:complete len:149 (-) Transcript_23832:344-790(-)